MPVPRTTSDVESPARERAVNVNLRGSGRAAQQRFGFTRFRNRLGTAVRAPRRRGRTG